MGNKVKVLGISDFITQTGFARVAHGIFEPMLGEIELKVLGVNYHGDPHKSNIEVYPAGLGGDLYGINRLQQFVSFKPDVIFILNDVWVIDSYLDAIRKIFASNMPKIVCYFPVDATEHDSDWYKNFDLVTIPVTYTEYAREVVLKAAPELASKLLVIPHGVDSDVFYKLEGTRAEFRRNLFGPDNNLEDKFIILSASRNQPRKRLDITMRGFKIFAKDKPDVRLYMHCGVVDASIHVAKEAVRLGIDEKLIISNLNYGPQQVPLERLNMIYNACDVGINTSMGEGWGLPIVEHAVTGAPQIVPNHSACAELYGDCGLLVPTVTHYTFDTIMTVGMLVSPEDVAIQMENIYQNKDLYAKLSTAGVEKFTRPEYQWNHISSRWLGVFREACSK